MTEQKSTSATPSSFAARLPAALTSARSKRLALWLAGLFLLLGLFGFLAAPPLLKSLLVKQLSQELQREVSIERIDINPYALTAEVAGVSVKTAEGVEQAGFDQLFVNLSSMSLFKAAAAVDEVRLQGLRLKVARLPDGRLDIADLIEKWSQPKDEPDTGTPRFSFNNIRLVDASLVVDDRLKNKLHTVDQINFTLPFLSSLPYQAEILVEPAFSARIDGAELALKGSSKPFAKSHESELRLDLDRFDLTALRPYLPENLPLQLGSGTVDSDLKLVFREVSDQVYSLAVEGGVQVDKLAIAERDGQPLLGWKKLAITLEQADLVNRKIALKAIALDGFEAQAAVDRKGELNWLRVADRLAKMAPASEAAPAKASEAPALAWSLGEFTLTGAQIHWHDASNAKPVAAEIADLQLRVGALDSTLKGPLRVEEVSARLDAGEALKLGKLAFKDISVDLAGQRVDVGELSATQWRARLARDKDGRIDWLTPPNLKTAPATSAKSTGKSAAPAKPWLAQLAKLRIDDVGLRFEDKSAQPAMIQTLDGFSLSGENLGTVPGSQGSIALKGKVNQKGSVDVSGKLQLQPLDAALRIETVALPLMPLQPYFADYLNIALTRGQLSNKGEATVSQQGDKLKASYKGSLTLGDFLAVDKLNSADFLKWKSLYFGGIDFRLDPLAVNVGEIALSDFYSRLILNKEGRLNVADIVRQPAEGETPAPAVAKAEPAKPMPPVKIAKITLQNGTVNFSDFFVKPNYSVNLTRLGGRVNGLSSAEGTVADMELRGSYANSAPVQIVAQLNPLAAQSYLDLKADVTGVDLVGFSPYSGKYAGYAIDKGKLSLNVGYKLENGKLDAQNKLFIDQLTFGDKVDSPDATKLPVNLAIALLKNSRGEIDLDLPISGSLDDPQFSVGGLIVKVIVNLFVKAVTSPFALLGSLFGGGEELSNIEFAAGYAALDAAAGKRLESLAKALADRDALKLEITGRADPESDREGLKRAAIERAMKAEKLKDMTKKGGEGVSLDEMRIEPEEYGVYLARAYKEAKFPKPRNLIGLHKDLPREEMEKLMLTNLPASDEDVRALAISRAEAVQAWLVGQGKVAPGRIFLLPPKIEADREAKAKSSRVDFSLR